MIVVFCTLVSPSVVSALLIANTLCFTLIRDYQLIQAADAVRKSGKSLHGGVMQALNQKISSRQKALKFYGYDEGHGHWISVLRTVRGRLSASQDTPRGMCSAFLHVVSLTNPTQNRNRKTSGKFSSSTTKQQGDGTHHPPKTWYHLSMIPCHPVTLDLMKILPRIRL